MTTFTWTITRIEAADQGGLQGVCIQACFDIKGEREGKQGFAQGDVLLGAPDPEHFTPTSELTHEQAIAWVKEALGERVADYEARINEQIDRQLAPRPFAVDLPWAPPEEVATADNEDAS
jgi:hypothetical protein